MAVTRISGNCGGGRVLAIILSSALISQMRKQVLNLAVFFWWVNVGTGSPASLLLSGLYSFSYSSRGKDWWASTGTRAALSGILCLEWIGTSHLCSPSLLPLNSQCVFGIHNTVCSAFSSGEGVWDATEGEEARRSVWWAKDFFGDAGRTSECQLPDWGGQEEDGNWGRRETKDKVGQMVSCSLFPAECSQGPSPVADCHAAIWTTPVVPQPENSWAELAHPRGEHWLSFLVASAFWLEDDFFFSPSLIPSYHISFSLFFFSKK